MIWLKNMKLKNCVQVLTLWLMHIYQHENNINANWIAIQKAFSTGKSEDDWAKQVILFSVVNKSKSL